MAKRNAAAETPANGQQRPTPAYFLSLSLENVRCFGEKQTLDLSDGKGGPARWTVLLGNNGTGKTTVLQALVAFYWAQFRPIPASDQSNGPVHVASIVSILAHTQLNHLFITFPRHDGEKARLAARFGPTDAAAARVDGKPVGRFLEFWTAGGGIACHGGPEQSGQSQPFLPLVTGYGASRRSDQTQIAEEDSPDPTRSLFTDAISLINAEEWLVRLDYASSKPSPLQERGRLRLQQVTELLISVLPEVEAIRFVVEGDVKPTARVEFQTPYGWVPMRQLGYGYQTVIAWMVDLASRMVEHYPDSPDPLAEPVIVLVDEIDLHLHPTWQRSLIARLDQRFPKAQFIVTAHSPLVVQAAPDANLAVLRRVGDQVVIDNDVDAIRNWRVDQILTSELFGLPTARPPQIEKDLARRAELLQKPRLTAAEQKEVEALDARIGPLPGGETAEQRRIMGLLERSLELIGKEQSDEP